MNDEARDSLREWWRITICSDCACANEKCPYNECIDQEIDSLFEETKYDNGNPVLAVLAKEQLGSYECSKCGYPNVCKASRLDAKCPYYGDLTPSWRKVEV